MFISLIIVTMCLILFAYRTHPGFPFVLAANRDEFHCRPSREAQFWCSEEDGDSGLLAGKDLQLGGTWLGVTASGRFAAITNFREQASSRTKSPRSRGELTLNYLRGEQSPEQYLHGIRPQNDLYAGYNLLVGNLAGDHAGLFYLSHSLSHGENEVKQLAPGIYGLSNHLLDSDWPKIRMGKQALEASLIGLDKSSLDIDSLTDIMLDKTIAKDADLPDTGVGIALERRLSARFIVNKADNYGTRCSTVIVQRDSGLLCFAEQNYSAEGAMRQRHYFEFTLKAQGHL